MFQSLIGINNNIKNTCVQMPTGTGKFQSLIGINNNIKDELAKKNKEVEFQSLIGINNNIKGNFKHCKAIFRLVSIPDRD